MSRLARFALIALMVAVSAIASLALLRPQHQLALNWDEVDYLNAARHGVITNLWERGSLSLPAYVRFAESKLKNTEPHLPPSYDEPNDPIHLRHGHTPGVVVAMVPTASSRSEPVQRLVQAIGAVTLTVAVVLAYLILAQAWTWLGLAAILAIMPWYDWHLFRTIEFHGWETVWLLAAAVCTSQWLKTDHDRRWGIALCASLALCIVTLESGLFVAVGVLVCLVLWVRGLRRKSPVPWIRRFALPGLGLVAAAVVLMWPGSVIKGSVLKIPLERVYQVFLGSGNLYYHRPAADRLAYVLPLLVIVPTLGYLLWRQRADARRWGPLAVIGVVYGLLIVKFAALDVYYFPAVAPFIVLLGMVVGTLRQAVRAALVAVTVVFMIFAGLNVARINRSDLRADRVTRADFAFLGTLIGSSPALMDGGHIFRHYVSDRIGDISFNNKELLLRRAGKYVPLAPGFLYGKVVGLLATRTAFLRSDAARQLSTRCHRTDRPTVVVWDCRSPLP